MVVGIKSVSHPREPCWEVHDALQIDMVYRRGPRNALCCERDKESLAAATCNKYRFVKRKELCPIWLARLEGVSPLLLACFPCEEKSNGSLLKTCGGSGRTQAGWSRLPFGGRRGRFPATAPFYEPIIILLQYGVSVIIVGQQGRLASSCKAL